jgi:hypothetical protein
MANHKYTRKFTGGRGQVNGGNPYYHPESCGLEMVGTAEREPDWDFSILLVVKDKKTGKLFAGYDSGCSCPTPFEDYHSLEDFDLITDTKQLDELGGPYVSKDELLTLKRKVHKLLK